jgi:hypothetical protein
MIVQLSRSFRQLVLIAKWFRRTGLCVVAVRGMLITVHCLAIGALTTKAIAEVTVAGATGGIGLSADKAVNGSAPGLTTLGDILITENDPADFPVTGGQKTLILTAPAGWKFGSTVTVTSSGADISIPTLPLFDVSGAFLTITIDVTATGANDELRISGLQVQALNAANIPAAGAILRTAAQPGTAAAIDGIDLDLTSFGDLSQAGPPTADDSTVDALPTSVAADGVATKTLKEKLLDAGTNPVT